MTTPLLAPVSIVVRARGEATQGNPQSRMMLIPEEGQGQPVLIPYAPREVDYDGLAGEYVNLTRPGLPDALLYSRAKLKKISFTILLVDRELRGTGGAVVLNIDAIATINQLAQYAAAGTKMRMAYSSLEAGSWRITDFKPSSVLRDQYTDEVTHATATMELTQASDVIVGQGPVTGGVTSPPTSSPPAAAPAATAYYTTIKGDTLWGIAVKYYKNGNKWQQIADANGIKDPRSLQIGVKLRIP